MKIILQIIFSLILAAMIAVTIWAGSFESVMAGSEKLFREPWGIATLFDTYLGFLTFYAWVFYKERAWLNRFNWLLAIIILGNIATAVYMLWQLRKLNSSATPADLLLRRA